MTAALPAVALLVSLCVYKIKRNAVRVSFIIGIIVIGISQFFTISYLPKTYSFFESFNSMMGMKRVHNYPLYEGFLYFDPRYGTIPTDSQFVGFLHAYNSDWSIHNISKLISEDAMNLKKEVIISAYDLNAGHIVGQPLAYTLLLENLRNYQLYSIEDTTTIQELNLDKITLLDYSVKESDYFILTNLPYENPIISGTITKIKERNKLLGEFVLPNEVIIYIYKRI
jgi:hypothetical protein